jgi:5,5'-dehydrodivanillate O-demethylase
METEIYRDFEHTGPGTLAGRYMRSFWQPVYRAEDLAPGAAVPIWIMSEDFTLYRGHGGALHLVAFRCAHRGTQLSTGWVEEDCIRCRYHGWKYDGSGRCVEQPGEDASFAEKVKIPSYPVREYLGLIFAYLAYPGDGEPPPFRRYPQFEVPGLLITLPPERWPCNYFSRLDNDPDAGHVLFTHQESIQRAQRSGLYPDRGVGAELTPYGVRIIVRVTGQPLDYLYSYQPNVNQIRVRTGVASARGEEEKRVWEDRMTWAVPIDDESSFRFEVNLVHVSGVAAGALEKSRREETERVKDFANKWGEKVLAGQLSIEDLGREFSTYEMFRVEDYVCQVGQGRIANRSEERLGHVDVGVVLRRKLWERELKALAEGRPLAEWIIPEARDEAQHGAPVEPQAVPKNPKLLSHGRGA